MRAKLGPAGAVTAAAHKLARILYTTRSPGWTRHLGRHRLGFFVSYDDTASYSLAQLRYLVIGQPSFLSPEARANPLHADRPYHMRYYLPPFGSTDDPAAYAIASPNAYGDLMGTLSLPTPSGETFQVTAYENPVGRVGTPSAIFTSDNGGLSVAAGNPTSNLPLRAGKAWLYEGGIREPWIIRVPGLTKPGSVCATPVISTDFYPTMLDLVGLPLNPAQHLDGVSLVPLLKAQALERGPLFWHFPHYANCGGAPSAAVRDGDWKLIEWYEDGQLELFNLAADLGEHRNLAGSNLAKARELQARLAA